MNIPLQDYQVIQFDFYLHFPTFFFNVEIQEEAPKIQETIRKMGPVVNY